MRKLLTFQSSAAVACAILVVGLGGCTQKASHTAAAPPVSASAAPSTATAAPADLAMAMQGHPAPNFSVSSTKGQPITLASLHGHVVLLDFWATWCGPCKMAMPTLQALQVKFKPQGFRVIGISEDDFSSYGAVPSVVKKLGVTYTIVASPGKDPAVGRAYHVAALPTQVLIGKDGVVRWVKEGFSFDEGDQLSKIITSLDSHSA